MAYRSRDRGRGRTWHGGIPFPLQHGGMSYRFRCMWGIGKPPGYTVPGAKQGQKGSVMHRFRGHRGKLDAKKYQVPPRFPRLRGCTRPIVNSWVKFFPWGTGEGVPFWACQAKSTCGHSTGGIYFWSVSASSGLHPISDLSSKIDTRPFHVRRGKHAAIPRGTYRPRRRAYPSGGQL